jgi:polyisoprenoid-binding protein YceI
MVWVIDPSHSQVTFAVKHMMISTVRGHFKSVTGTLEINEQNLIHSWVEAQVEVAGIDTRDPGRDQHLRSAEFFDAEKFPLLTFKSAKMESLGNNNYNVIGDLTVHGVTKQVTFKAEYGGSGKDPWGNQRAGLNGHTRINRKDFGLNWNQALEAGGVLVGDEVTVSIELEAVKQ